MSWARPFDTASSVANSVYSLTGSCVLSTVTDVPRRIRSVRLAIADQDHMTRRVDVPWSVVLADVVRVDPDRLSEHRFIDHQANGLGVAQQASRRVGTYLPERV